PALVRLAPRRRWGAAERGASPDGPQHDPDDDALQPPRARAAPALRRPRRQRGAESAANQPQISGFRSGADEEAPSSQLTHPPAEPGGFICEPLKAAGMGAAHERPCEPPEGGERYTRLS